MSTAAAKRKLSKTPSWIMVGFVLGVLTILGFQADKDEQPAPSPGETAPSSAAPAPTAPLRNVTALDNRPSLAAIEAVFARFRDLAFWENDLTEVALWNSATNEFSDHYEVTRNAAGAFFFRSIPRFTRLPLENYGPPNCPLRFTETETMREDRLTRAANLQKAPEPEPLNFPTPAPPETGPRRP
ncbi:MAG TPA: hypothetical protein VGD81_20595 [Opitutaceae bacterium]